MFDTDSSDDEVSVALKKSVDAMATSGATSTKQQVNPLISSTSSIKMGHLPTIVKTEPTERPALMSDDDMLDAVGGNRSRPPTPGLLMTDKKSAHPSSHISNENENDSDSSTSSKKDKKKNKKDKKDKHRRTSGAMSDSSSKTKKVPQNLFLINETFLYNM